MRFPFFMAIPALLLWPAGASSEARSQNSSRSSVIMVVGGLSPRSNYEVFGLFIDGMKKAYFQDHHPVILDGGGPENGFTRPDQPEMIINGSVLKDDHGRSYPTASSSNLNLAFSQVPNDTNLTEVLTGHGNDGILALWADEDFSEGEMKRQAEVRRRSGASTRYLLLACHSQSFARGNTSSANAEALLQQFPPKLCGFTSASHDEFGYEHVEENPEMMRTLTTIKPITLANFKKVYRENIYYYSRNSLTSDVYLEQLAHLLVSPKVESSEFASDVEESA